MKFLPIALLALMILPSFAEEPFIIVHARTVKVSPAPSLPDLRDEQDMLEGLPPPSPIRKDVWIAELRIERVFLGDMSFVGQLMFVETRNKMVAGNSSPIIPKLNEGEEGIFAIRRLADGVLTKLYDPPSIAEGPLPLIKGRDAGFEKALLRLMSSKRHEVFLPVPQLDPELNAAARPTWIIFAALISILSVIALIRWRRRTRGDLYKSH